MKKIALSLMVVALAGCGAQKLSDPANEPVPPGFALLGTFEGEVDSAKGIFNVRIKPNEAGTAAGMRSVRITPGISTVSIANDAACPEIDPITELPVCSWNNAARAECNGENGTGGYVKITSNYAATTIPGALYAKITAVSAAGVTPCNSAPAPSGMTDLAGLWSYGTIGPGLYTSKAWSFSNASTTNFQFVGAIYGVLAVESTSPVPQTTVSGLGTKITFGINNTSTVATMNSSFVEESATVGGGARGTVVNSVAGDLVNSRIWYATTGGADSPYPNYVGYIGSDLTGGSYATVEGTSQSNLLFRNVVPDPHVAARAWFIQNTTAGSTTYRLRSASGTTVAVDATNLLISTTLSPSSMAIDSGSGKRLVLVNPGGNSTATGTFWWVNTTTPTVVNAYAITPMGNCRRPRVIVNSGAGTFLYGTEWGSVCSFAASNGAITKIWDAGMGAVTGIAFDGNGDFWVSTAAGIVARYNQLDVDHGIDYSTSVPEGTPSALVAADGYLWTMIQDLITEGTPILGTVRVQP